MKKKMKYIFYRHQHTERQVSTWRGRSWPRGLRCVPVFARASAASVKGSIFFRVRLLGLTRKQQPEKDLAAMPRSLRLRLPRLVVVLCRPGFRVPPPRKTARVWGSGPGFGFHFRWKEVSRTLA